MLDATKIFGLAVVLTLLPVAASGQSIYDEMRKLDQESRRPPERRPMLSQLPGAQQALRVPLRPKPGYIIGRIIDPKGRPIDAGVIIHVQGSPAARAFEWAGDFTPDIDPRTGYYEIRVEDGEWRVNAKASPELLAMFPATHECLIMWEDFLPPNVDRYLDIQFQDSRRGVVQDLIWNPEPYFARKCGEAARAQRER
jgi:hypothetical protein